MKCVRTEFTKTILCAGSMDEWLKIYRRQNLGTDPGQLEIQSGLVLVEEMAGNLEEISGTPRYNGVNTEDILTHYAYCSYDQTIYELDLNNLFILVESGDKNRVFKMKKIQNYSESSTWIRFHLTETGFDDNEASYV